MAVELQTMNSESPKSKRDLNESERRFLIAMQELGYGRFESLRILQGELVLEPWPTMVRSIKFGNATPNRPASGLMPFELKDQATEFFDYVRSVEAGTIRVLEVRGGLPFSMEVAALNPEQKTWP